MAPASRTHLWETVLAGKWQNLGDVALQDALESALSSGSDGYQFKARGYTYDIDFGRMKQVNVTTKRERNLRRVPDPRASSDATAAVVPTSAGVSVPSTVLHHGPIAGRLHTGGGHRTRATKAGSLLHPGSAAPAASPVPIVLKTTAPPTAAKAASVASVWTRSVKAAPVATAVTSKAPVAATPAPVAATPAPVATAPAPVAPPPPPTPTPAKKPLPHQGKVKTFFKEKGYGFIRLEDDREVFFHLTCVSDLLDGSIRANDTVEVLCAKARALQVRVKARGSIFKQMCSNKCCRDKGDRHFEDRCPLKRS